MKDEVLENLNKVNEAIDKAAERIQTLEEENEKLKVQLAKMTKDRDDWKQRAIDTYDDF